MTKWPNNHMTEWPNDQMADWPNANRPNEWMSKLLNYRRTGSFADDRPYGIFTRYLHLLSVIVRHSLLIKRVFTSVLTDKGKLQFLEARRRRQRHVLYLISNRISISKYLFSIHTMPPDWRSCNHCHCTLKTHTYDVLIPPKHLILTDNWLAQTQQ